MKNFTEKFSGILLAGGKSSRMGEDKAFLKYGGLFLYQYNLKILEHFSDNLIISSSNTAFNQSNYLRVEDDIPGLGPIGGIYSSLKRISYKNAIVLPCDLPFITIDIIDTLIANSHGYEICIAQNMSGQPEPLVGIYSTSILPNMEDLIKKGKYKIRDLLSEVNTNFISFENSPKNTFQNVNYPEDYKSLPPLPDYI